MMRELTLQEEAQLVSKSKLESLESGTRIAVKWSDGVGPYAYTLKFSPTGLPFAVDQWGSDHLLSFIGFDEQHERVILAS